MVTIVLVVNKENAMADFEINVGDDITINGKVVEYDSRCDMVCYRMNDNTEQWTHINNINTICPVCKSDGIDQRKGN